MTVFIGTLIDRFQTDVHFDFKSDDCGFMTHQECVHGWRKIFSFRPEVFVDIWTPFVVGMIGVLFHIRPVFVSVFFPENWFTFAAYNLM